MHKLEELVSRASLDIDAYQSDLEIATNGQAKSEVIATVTLKERRKNGIFFTDASIARLAARYLKKDLQNGATVLDPT